MIAELVRNALAFVASIPIRLVPRAMRFRAVLYIARILTPVLGPLLLRRYENVVSGAADETARVCFRAMARMRVPLDTEFHPDMDEDVLKTLETSAAVFVTAHFPMNPVFTRWLLDHGHRAVLLRAGNIGEPTIWGTVTSPDYVHPGPRVLLDIRRALRTARTFLVAIDAATPGVRAVEAHGRFGTTAIATPIFAFAERLRLPLFFFAARLTRTGLPILTVRRIPYDPQAFVEHFRRHAEQMLP
jgi:hypothetical protein